MPWILEAVGRTKEELEEDKIDRNGVNLVLIYEIPQKY